jgi:signal transduction histidine kinase
VGRTGQARQVRWPLQSGPPAAALLLPVGMAGRSVPVGVALLGVSPHRPLEAAYRAFFEGVADCLRRGAENASVRDSERQRAEQQQRQLAAQLSEVEDAERRRLAHDLHDSIGQTLSVIKLGLETGTRAIEEGAPARQVLTGPLELLGGLIQQIRGMTFDLHPAMLDDLGLVPTLRRYAEQFTERTGLTVTVSESGPRGVLPVAVRNYLFRAIKELLNNAAKHAAAREVVVGVHWLAGGVRVVVDDDGRGFDVEAALAPEQRRGLGLVGIRERMAALGGRLLLESQPGEGTRGMLELRTE